MAKRKRKKKKKTSQFLYSLRQVIFGICCLAVILLVITGVTKRRNVMTIQRISENVEEDAPELDVQLLTVNEYSRPGTPLQQIRGVVIHYTANPGTSAIANRNYFEGLKDSHATKASSHFIVGLSGEIVQCIPTTEIAYASNDRNSDTISIECCYQKEDGSFEPETYAEVVHLTAWLCARSGLTADDVIRHYDVTGKMCPLYYVEHPDAWETFQKDVDTYIKGYKKKTSDEK